MERGRVGGWEGSSLSNLHRLFYLQTGGREKEREERRERERERRKNEREGETDG